MNDPFENTDLGEQLDIINEEIEEKVDMKEAVRYKFRTKEYTKNELMYFETDLNRQITGLYLAKMEALLSVVFE